jgi:hypothetical protein
MYTRCIYLGLTIAVFPAAMAHTSGKMAARFVNS